MLSINTNTASIAAVNAINKSSASLSTSMERLATGNRINSSADDSAGKQIASRLTSQSNGMAVALRNINDATAMLNTADSMFDEMTDVLGRMKDLSTQAANGTYDDQDLQAMQDEYDELGQQMSDMLQNTTYGGTGLFDGKIEVSGVTATAYTDASGNITSVSYDMTGATVTYEGDNLFSASGGVTFQVGAESADTMNVDISDELGDLVTQLAKISHTFTNDQNVDVTNSTITTLSSDTSVPISSVSANSLNSLDYNEFGTGGTELTTAGSANDMIGNIQSAMNDVAKIQSQLGASVNRLTDTAANLTSMQDNTEVAIGNIMDTDYAAEASNMTKQQVLMQTGITMLKQSNSMSSMVSSLLQ
ncbi:TPA: flagellin [Citrobacter freundii]